MKMMKRIPDKVRQQAKAEAADAIDEIMDAAEVLHRLRPILAQPKPKSILTQDNESAVLRGKDESDK